MSLIDFILNLAGLLLWVSWRYIPFDPINRIRPATLTGTLRRAEPTRIRSWHFLAALVALLLVRAVFYWWIGGALDWTPGLKLGAIAISFRSDFFWRMMGFSMASFGQVLVIFHLSLLLLSLVNGRGAEGDPCHRFVKIQLGPLHNWPFVVKLLCPLAALAVVWMAGEPLLALGQIVPPAQSWIHRLEQATVLGLSLYPGWRYLIGALLLLHLLNTYVYLGQHPLWNYVSQTSRRLLAPLNWLPLRLGQADFAPLLGIALVFLLGEAGERGLTQLYGRLPL